MKFVTRETSDAAKDAQYGEARRKLVADIKAGKAMKLVGRVDRAGKTHLHAIVDGLDLDLHIAGKVHDSGEFAHDGFWPTSKPRQGSNNGTYTPGKGEVGLATELNAQGVTRAQVLAFLCAATLVDEAEVPASGELAF